MKKRELYLTILQLILWGAFLALPYYMLPHSGESEPHHEIHHSRDWAYYMFLSSVAFNICLIIFFYVHHFFLFDQFILKRKNISYVVICFASFLSIFFLSYEVRNILLGNADHYLVFREIVRTLTWFMLILLVDLGIKLVTQWQQAEQRAKEIENVQLRTELSFLHMQINPHFLFNSLNTIYGLSLKKSDSAPLAVLKLSQLLRYVIEESGNEKVSLAEEVTYLENFIELQKLRSTSSLMIDFQTEGNMTLTFIAPMLLLPFVENAFKYGIHNSQPSPIDIRLKTDTRQMTFTITNRKFEQSEQNSTGIGIPNVERRLALLYPEKHELKIDNTPTTFTIHLTLDLT